MFYKKLLATVVTFCMLSASVSAEMTVNVDFDFETEKVNISGVGSENQRYGMWIFEDGKDVENIEDDVLMTDVMYLYKQGMTDNDGEFYLNISAPKKTGIYKYYIGTIEDGKTTGEFCYATESDRADYIAEINNASKTEIYDVLKNRSLYFGISTEQVESCSEELLTRVVYSALQDEKLSTSDHKDATKKLRAYIALANVVEGNVTNLNDSPAAFEVLGDRFKTWYNNSVVKNAVKEKICSSVKNSKGDYADIVKALNDSLILSFTRITGGTKNLTNLYTDYAEYLGIKTSDITNNAVNKVIGKSYDTIADLLKALKEAKSKSEGDSGSSGGGGGSGSGSTKKSSVVQGPVLAVEENTPAEKVIVPDKIKNFEDIADYDWATEAILVLANKNIVAGKSESIFAPAHNVTRAEFTKMVMCAMNEPLAEYSDVFSDVKAEDWFAPYVLGAYKLGIVSGTGEGLFNPYDTITRQDMAVMVMNAVNGKLEQKVASIEIFEDENQISSYAKEAIKALQAAGIMNGQGNNKFNPKATATRAEAAVIIFKSLDYLVQR